MSEQVHGIFEAPIYDCLRPWLNKFSAGCAPGPNELNALSDLPPLSGGGVPIRFVRPATIRSRRFADQFEVRTYQRGEIAVRESSWHDTFNALVWLAFPRTKAAINKGHFDKLDHERVRRAQGESETMLSSGRGRTRDALTLFDESGIIVASSNPDLLELIRLHKWKELFWSQRVEVRERMRFFVIGHALYEKAMQPYKSMTARALMLSVPGSFLDQSISMQVEEIDEQVAEGIGTPIATGAFRILPPIPVMGVPTWADNANSDFYDDAEVFR
ncbi:MAG: DUF3025 domain-containing protein [Burkholderiales bacterium]